MAIFKKKQKEEDQFVTKEIFIDSLQKLINEECPKWHILVFDEDLTKEKPFDVLLIRTFDKITTKIMNGGLPNPFHKEKEEQVQIVIPISCIPKRERAKIAEDFFDSTKKWTYTHIISDDLKAIYSKLKEIEDEHS